MLQAEPSSTNSKKTNGMKHFFILLNNTGTPPFAVFGLWHCGVGLVTFSACRGLDVACAFILVGTSTLYAIVRNYGIFEVDRSLSSEVLTETVHQSRAEHSRYMCFELCLIVAVMAPSEQ